MEHQKGRGMYENQRRGKKGQIGSGSCQKEEVWRKETEQGGEHEDEGED